MTFIHSGLERTRGKHMILVSGVTYGDWRLIFSTHVNIFLTSEIRILRIQLQRTPDRAFLCITILLCSYLIQQYNDLFFLLSLFKQVE